jgi:replicative DNA helicase Mcm
MTDYCLNQIAKDKDTGQIDIDRLSSKITATQRSSIGIIKDIIHTLEEQTGQKIIPIEQILQAAQEKNINQETAEDILEKLRRSGDVFEPKKGFIQKL